MRLRQPTQTFGLSPYDVRKKARRCFRKIVAEGYDVEVRVIDATTSRLIRAGRPVLKDSHRPVRASHMIGGRFKKGAKFADLS
jgi:hypothetical protein